MQIFSEGLKNLVTLFSQQELPAFFKIYIERAEQLLKETPLAKISSSRPGEKFSPLQNLYFGYHIRNRYKNDTLELLDIFGRLDAWYSMAMAMKTF